MVTFAGPALTTMDWNANKKRRGAYNHHISTFEFVCSKLASSTTGKLRQLRPHQGNTSTSNLRLTSLVRMSSKFKRFLAGTFNRRKKRDVHSNSPSQGTSRDNNVPPQDDEIVPPVPQTTYASPILSTTHNDDLVLPVPTDTTIAVLSVPSQGTLAVPATYHLHAGTTLNVSARDQYNYNTYTVQRMFYPPSSPLPAFRLTSAPLAL
jgi:hypothetical protein